MTCIAIDDEPLALEVIKSYAAATPIIRLANTFTDAIQAMIFLKTRPVDLVILDIRMPDISGIQFLQNLKNPPLVIFTTAYAEYAVKGFELEAVDYLLKPVKFERFVQALERAGKRLAIRASGQETREEGALFVKSGYGSVRVVFNDILYIEGLDDYIRIHFADRQQPVLSLMSLKSILEKLPADRFMRVHRSFIVSLRHVRSIRKKTVFLGNTGVPVGDTYAEAVQTWLSSF
jgi:two-component system, LytTR family, response regulator